MFDAEDGSEIVLTDDNADRLAQVIRSDRELAVYRQPRGQDTEGEVAKLRTELETLKARAERSGADEDVARYMAKKHEVSKAAKSARLI